MSHDHDGLGQSTKTRIHKITGLQVQQLLAKLDVIRTHLPFLDSLELHEILSSNDDVTSGEDTGKHVLQEASILGHLRRIGALTTTTTCAIELGAGTGRLSDRLQRVTNASLDHILIDRQDFAENQCRDRVLRARVADPKVKQKRRIERVVVDIASLNLQDYCTSSSCLCMSKHLCGPACDLTIGALSRMSTNRPPAAIATCCHYLCTWESFAGRRFWEALGLTEEDFLVAVTASQWASLQSKPKYNANKPRTNNSATTTDHQNGDKMALLPDLSKVAVTVATALGNTHTHTANIVPSEEFEKKFTRQEKTALGVQLKRLLDLSRAARLQDLGYNVQLVRYTTRSIDDRLLLVHTTTSEAS